MTKSASLPCILSSTGHEEMSVCAPLIGRLTLLLQHDQLVRGFIKVGTIQQLNRVISLHLELDDVYVVKRVHNMAKHVAYGHPLFNLKRANITDHAGSAKQREQRNERADRIFVRAPMEGMFYARPSPEENNFVAIGDIIEPKQTIGLIEVMKCYYPITYEGTQPLRIKALLVDDKSALESNTPIVELEKIE